MNLALALAFGKCRRSRPECQVEVVSSSNGYHPGGADECLQSCGKKNKKKKACLMKCKVDTLGSSGIKAAALYSMHIQHVSRRQHRHSTLVHIYVES